ncbi:hypothetical protein HS041_14735 [Planomonospora sp. ID67723]|uniref:beta family protein n=1 Tax=Planomonospora sp. ID67723 TaxID=2738134 RepID=UPI0018C37814|nr:hypothetical protein [Planomonospora sp. ID67723]MBG0829027.1 hypothetical protein [Planomonospora sp. ID67723]
MTVYTPILKGRRPALQALGHVADRVKGNIRPIIEVVPGRRDEDIKVVVTRLAKAVGRYIPEGVNLTFDTGSPFQPDGADQRGRKEAGSR